MHQNLQAMPPDIARNIPRNVDIHPLRSTAELESLVAPWSALWAADPRARPFQHPDWLIPWWRHFSQPDLRTVAIRETGTLLAILPLYVYPDPVSGDRQLLLLGAGTSDYLDGIFSPACTPQHVLAALDLLREDPSWDVAHFTQLLPESPLFRALQELGQAVAVPHLGEICSRCPAVPIADLPAKLRSSIRYYRNFAIGRGELDLTAATEPNLQEAFDLLVRFHTERWQEAGEPGVLADPAVLAWHREALPRLHAADLLRLYLLRLDSEPIAVLYALSDPSLRPARTQFFYLIGHASAHADLRPGMLLTALAVERAAAEGVRTIDMLRGQETYKQFWHVKSVPTYGFTVRRR